MNVAGQGNTVTVTWQPPSVGGIPTSYVVEAALSPGGAAVASITVSATSLAVPDVANGVYDVRVRGVNSDGIGTQSTENHGCRPWRESRLFDASSSADKFARERGWQSGDAGR